MRVIRKKGFKIASSGVARQVVLLCHGGLGTDDGTTTIPMGLRVCFYAQHGERSKGYSVYDAVMARGRNARGGMMKQIMMSDTDVAEYAEHHRQSIEEARGVLLGQAVGVYDSFGGGNPMFNYCLRAELRPGHARKANSIFETHARGGLNADIDLMMIHSSKRKHLSDVWKVIKDKGYTTLHFAPCRELL